MPTPQPVNNSSTDIKIDPALLGQLQSRGAAVWDVKGKLDLSASIQKLRDIKAGYSSATGKGQSQQYGLSDTTVVRPGVGLLKEPTQIVQSLPQGAKWTTAVDPTQQKIAQLQIAKQVIDKHVAYQQQDQAVLRAQPVVNRIIASASGPTPVEALKGRLDVAKDYSKILLDVASNPKEVAMSGGIKQYIVKKYFPEVPKAVTGFAVDVAQMAPRALASIGVGVGESGMNLPYGSGEWKPEGTFEKMIFGDEPIKGVTKRSKEAAAWTNKQLVSWGLNPKSANNVAKYVGPFFVGGITTMDLWPMFGGEAKLARKLAKITDELKILEKIKPIFKGVDEELLRIYASDLSKINTEAGVNEYLKKKVAQNKIIEALAQQEKDAIANKGLTPVERNIDEILKADNTIGKARNPKPGRVEMAIDQIKAGSKRAVQVRTMPDGSTVIEDGGHLLEAYRKLGYKTVPVIDVTKQFIKVTDAEINNILSKAAKVFKENGFSDATVTKNIANFSRFLSGDLELGIQVFDPSNKISRSIFESATGIKLPKTISGTEDTLAKYLSGYTKSKIIQPTGNISIKQAGDKFYAVWETGAAKGKPVPVGSFNTKEELIANIQRHNEVNGLGASLKEIEEPVKKGTEVTFQGKQGKITDILKTEGDTKYNIEFKNGKNIWTNEAGIRSALNTQQKQVAKTISQVPKTIKQIAEETAIKEPNVRRILGVGAKEGTFTRVEKGVYVLSKDGKDLAYIEAGDAMDVLPRLVKEGKKFDQIVSDLPFESGGTMGGNRNLAGFETITPQQYAQVVKNFVKLLKDEDSTVIHIMTTGKSSVSTAKQYNAAIINNPDLKLVAVGEYIKLRPSGEIANMGKYPMPPEKIMIFNKSGKAPKGVVTGFEVRAISPHYLDKKGYYKTQKARELADQMVDISAKGGTILDPFAGSGVFGEAAVKSGRSAYLVEKNPEVVENIIKPRMESAIPPKAFTDTLLTQKQELLKLADQNADMGSFFDDIMEEINALGFKNVDELRADVKASEKIAQKYQKPLAQTASDPLLQEARGKSFDEFLKAQGTPVYHGTPNNIEKPTLDMARKDGALGQGIYVSRDLVNSESRYAGEKGKVIELVLPKETKLYKFDRIYDGKTTALKNRTEDLIDAMEMFKQKNGISFQKATTERGGDGASYNPKYLRTEKGSTQVGYFWKPSRSPLVQELKQLWKEKLIKEGYDGVNYGSDIVLFNDVIKTKSQLLDIWKKANQSDLASQAKPLAQTVAEFSGKASDAKQIASVPPTEIPKVMEQLPEGEMRGVAKQLLESEKIPENVKIEVAKMPDKMYSPTSNIVDYEWAKNLVENDYDSAKTLLEDGVYNAKYSFVSEVMASKAYAEGRLDDGNEIIRNLMTKATDAGQGNQALRRLTDWWRSPENAVAFAEKEIKRSYLGEGLIGKASKEKNIQKAKDSTKKVIEEVRAINQKETDNVLNSEKISKKIDELISKPVESEAVPKSSLQKALTTGGAEKAPQVAEVKAVQPSLFGDKLDLNKIIAENEDAGKLAIRIENALKPTENKVLTERDQMIDTLFKVAKENLPEKPGVKIPSNPYQILAESLVFRGKYADTWQKTKAVLNQRFKNEPEKLKQLNEVIDYIIGRPFDKKTVSSAVKQTLADSKIIIRDLVRQHYSAVNKTKADLVKKIVDKTGYQEADVQMLVNEIAAEFNLRTADAKKKILDRLLVVKKSPETAAKTKSIVDELMEYSNLGAFDERKYYERVAEKLKLPVLTAEDTAFIVDSFNRAQKATDLKEKEALIRGVLEMINKKIPVGVLEWLDAFRYQNILSNPRSQLRDTVYGLSTGGIIEPLRMTVEGLVDWGLAPLRGGKRSAYVKEVPAYYRGFFSNFLEGFEVFKETWRGGQRGKIQDLDLKLMKMERLPKYLQIVGRIKGGMDNWIRTMIQGGLIQANKAKGLSAEEGLAKAIEKAKYLMLQDPIDYKNKTGQGVVLSAFDGMAAGLNRMATYFPAMKYIVPFINTPIKIAKHSIEWSPLGFGTMIKNAKKQEQASKALVGSMISLIGVKKAWDGETTWTAPRDEEQKKLFYAEGRKQYSVKIGDHWIPFWLLGPVGFALALPAAAKYHFQDSPDKLTTNLGEKSALSVRAAMAYLTNQTSLRGLGTYLDLLTGETRNYDLMAATAFSTKQLVPAVGLITFIDNYFTDPVFRKASGFKEGLMKDIPFLSNKLTPVEALGGGVAERDLWNALLPYDVGKAADLYGPVMELYEKSDQLNKLKSFQDKEKEKIINDITRKMKTVKEEKDGAKLLEELILNLDPATAEDTLFDVFSKISETATLEQAEINFYKDSGVNPNIKAGAIMMRVKDLATQGRDEEMKDFMKTLYDNGALNDKVMDGMIEYMKNNPITSTAPSQQ